MLHTAQYMRLRWSCTINISEMTLTLTLALTPTHFNLAILKKNTVLPHTVTILHRLMYRGIYFAIDK